MNMKNSHHAEQTILEYGPYLFETGRHLLIEHGDVMISTDTPEKLKIIYMNGKPYFDRMYLRYLYLYNKYRRHAVTPAKNIEELIGYCEQSLHAESIGRINDPDLLFGHIRTLTGLYPDIQKDDLEFIGYKTDMNENMPEEDFNSLIVFEIRHDYYGTANQKLLRELAYQRGIDSEYLDTFNEKAWQYLLACDFYFSV